METLNKKVGRPVVNAISSICHPEVPSYAKGVCKSCYNAQYRKKNAQKLKLQTREWLDDNRERANENSKQWAKKNTDKVRQAKIKYRRNNPGLWANYCAKRHAAKLQRTPRWSDLAAIKQFYLNCPEGMVVDHIIPLQGENVSGLHVLENLQYLTPEENRAKWNKFEVA